MANEPNIPGPSTTIIRQIRPDFTTPVKPASTPAPDWGSRTSKPAGVERHSPMPTRPFPGFPNRPQGTED